MIRGFLQHAFVIAASSAACFAQSFNDYDLEPHDYFGASLNDPMSRLLERLGDPNEALNEGNGKPLVARLLKRV